jgi:hypothetical protein
MIRGIEKGRIVDDDDDRHAFVRRLGMVAAASSHNMFGADNAAIC